MNSLRRVALITGGSTGIGYATARVLAETGATVILAQIPGLLAQAQQAAAQLAPGEAVAVEVDIRDFAAVQRMVKFAVERFGQIDILVNNAGVTGPPARASFLSCSQAKLDEIVDVNLKGTFFCSQLVAQHMVETGKGGSIIHIASVGAFAAQDCASVYCATKAALVSLTQGMALELAAYQIRVNCVAPGDIETPVNRTARAAGKGTDRGRYSRITPLGHSGQPVDIGNAVAYLVSNEAKFVTGTTLVVDGGFLAY